MLSGESSSRQRSPRVSTYLNANAPGWVQITVTVEGGWRLFDGTVPEDELAQEVSVITTRWWRMELERELRERPPE